MALDNCGSTSPISIRDAGGEIHLGVWVDRIHTQGDTIVSVEGVNPIGERKHWAGNYFFSTMPVRDLIRAMGDRPPKEVVSVSDGLLYRDFMIVGLLARKLSVLEDDGFAAQRQLDLHPGARRKSWPPEIFNNWSPWLVSRPDRMWIGLEYFCNEGDDLWRSPQGC